METIVNNWDVILECIGGLIVAASVIVRLTPTKVDDGYFFKFLKILELLALNNKPVEVKSNTDVK